MEGFPQDDFWDFSIAVYARAPVAEACLHLQERHQVDVNLVLFCLWLGASGRGALDDAGLDRVRDRVVPWHAEVVRHLRALRARLKGGFGGAPEELCERLRRRIATTELDAEHLEQVMLSGSVDREADPGRSSELRKSDALGSLESYWRSLDVRLSDDDRAVIDTLVRQVFDDG